VKILEIMDQRAFHIFTKEKEGLIQLKPSYSDLLEWAAVFSTQSILLQAALNTFAATGANTLLNTINDPEEKEIMIETVIERLRNEVVKTAGDIHSLQAQKRSNIGANAANKRHIPTKEKHEAIRKKWTSGIYKSRNECAEAECKQLGMKFEAARNALKGMPDPTHGGC
jgi:hypothetical protein